MDIKAIRKSLGMTQKQFAEEFHLLHRTVQKWEGGERQCPDYLLRLIADKAEQLAGVTITLDKQDAENLVRLLGEMNEYAIGTVLSAGGLQVSGDDVAETQHSVMLAFLQLERKLVGKPSDK